MASREAGPPSGGHRRPPGGLESLRKILTMPPTRAASQFHRAQPLRARSRAGKALFHRAPRRPWPPERPSPPHGGNRRPPGGSESLRKILTMPPHWRRASSTVPSRCGRGRERAKPYSIVHPAAHGLQRGRARRTEATGGLPAARRAFVKF